MSKSYLVLEDGSVFEGESFGHETPAFGEVVFSTGMSGYQESLTDPSNGGQILVMTYPLIGNYGISDDYYMSNQVHAKAVVVREYCKEPSPMYGGRTLDDFLKRNKVPGISGIDTRSLVIKIRTVGALRGAVVCDKGEADSTVGDLKRMQSPFESDLVGKISSKKTEEHNFGKGIRIGLLDCGGKDRLMKELSQRFDVTVFPYDTKADAVQGHKIKGLVISDGPGNPAMVKTTIKTVADTSAIMPILGVGLGGQIAGLAMGGTAYKMKLGHRGSNQPVKYDGKVFITAQNHGFALDENSLKNKDLIADQTNVNDGTVEGFRHKNLSIFASQYHPETSPGPWDTSFLVDNFERAVKGGRK